MVEDVIIYDIETMQECFIVVCMQPGKLCADTQKFCH